MPFMDKDGLEGRVQARLIAVLIQHMAQPVQHGDSSAVRRITGSENNELSELQVALTHTNSPINSSRHAYKFNAHEPCVFKCSTVFNTTVRYCCRVIEWHAQ